MQLTSLSRRNVLVAAVLAAAAALLTAAYVSRTHGGPAAAAAATGPLTTVYFAGRDIATGTAGSQALADGALVPRRVPRDEVVPAAVTAPAQIRSLVAVQPLFAGEQATTRRFARPQLQGIRGGLRGTLRVISVPGSAEQLLAGTLQVGDHVDVVATLKPASGVPYGQIVLRNLLVVSAPAGGGTSVAGIGGGSGSGSSSVGLELTDVQAKKLFFVMENGSWSLVLRPPAHAADGGKQVESAATVLKGE